jgi:hypothetical protein
MFNRLKSYIIKLVEKCLQHNSNILSKGNPLFKYQVIKMLLALIRSNYDNSYNLKGQDLALKSCLVGPDSKKANTFLLIFCLIGVLLCSKNQITQIEQLVTR